MPYQLLTLKESIAKIVLFLQSTFIKLSYVGSNLNINQEKEWTKDGSLWNTHINRFHIRKNTMDIDSLPFTLKIRFNPHVFQVIDTIRGQFRKKIA